MICGFTAAIKTSDFFARSRLLFNTFILYSEVKKFWRLLFGSETKILDAFIIEDESKPFMIASAILPPPMNPIFLFFNTGLFSILFF